MMAWIPRILRRRRLIIALAVLGVVVAVLVVQPPFAVRTLEWLFPRIVWHVETQEPLIAVTFDDGPDPIYTPQVLEILARHNARATFFLIGEQARLHPELVHAIRAAGHEIGNHTDSHGGTVLASQRNFEASLLRAETTLELRNAKLLRPGGAWIRPAQLDYAAQHGYVTVLGSAYAFDPQRPPARYIEWVISKNLRPGAIVVLHDAGGNRSSTVAALESILAAAESKGLRSVTVSELIAQSK
jgi:peptidoglycan/xylan/chitin deacetylase (PgdA/CDA1 family)